MQQPLRPGQDLGAGRGCRPLDRPTDPPASTCPLPGGRDPRSASAGVSHTVWPPSGLETRTTQALIRRVSTALPRNEPHLPNGLDGRKGRHGADATHPAPKGSLGLRQSHAPDKSHHSTADRGGAAKATSPADRPLGARAGEAREAAGAGLRDARGDTALTARHRRALASVVLTSASRNLTDDTRTPQVTGISHLLPRPSKATKAHRVSSE